jgi:hypothetical protein
MIDGRSVGQTPLAMLLEPGAHVVAVDAPDHVTTRETVEVAAGAPVTRHFPVGVMAPAMTVPTMQPEPRRRAPAPPIVRSPASTAHGATDLLAAAREHRSRGDADRAIAAYRDLFARHATSPEAHAALVPFGEIELGRSDARAALDAFDAYLTTGGALEEEARFGRIRALRMLGRAAEERSAIEIMIERFPSGALSTSLHDRLRALTLRGPR